MNGFQSVKVVTERQIKLMMRDVALTRGRFMQVRGQQGFRICNLRVSVSAKDPRGRFSHLPVQKWYSMQSRPCVVHVFINLGLH